MQKTDANSARSVKVSGVLNKVLASTYKLLVEFEVQHALVGRLVNELQ